MTAAQNTARRNAVAVCKCRECGEQFGKARDHEQLFCSAACRTSFNNRRKQRGADLYDLFMTMRYERGTAKLLGVWAILCRLAQDWNDEDKAEGRKSYLPARRVLERHVTALGTRTRISK